LQVYDSKNIIEYWIHIDEGFDQIRFKQTCLEVLVILYEN
jgi:hypothetical protein